MYKLSFNKCICVVERVELTWQMTWKIHQLFLAKAKPLLPCLFSVLSPWMLQILTMYLLKQDSSEQKFTGMVTRVNGGSVVPTSTVQVEKIKALEPHSVQVMGRGE